MTIFEKKIRWGLSFLLALAALLAACARAQLSPTPALPPTTTPSRTASRLYALTATPRPTRTLEPTWTLSQSTRNALLTITPFLSSAQDDWSLSPNGTWLVQYRPRQDGHYPDDLQVRNIATGRVWQVMLDKWMDGGRLSPAHWSPDGRTLYVEYSGMMESSEYIYTNTHTLLRLDLGSGQVTRILPDGLWTYAFSGGSRLAYISATSGDISILVVLDLQTMVSHQIEIHGYCSLGEMLWAPAEDRILLHAAACDPDWNVVSYSLVLVDLVHDTQREVVNLDYPGKPPAPLEWQGEFPLYIQRDYSLHGTDRCFVLDLKQNVLIPAACP